MTVVTTLMRGIERNSALVDIVRPPLLPSDVSDNA